MAFEAFVQVIASVFALNILAAVSFGFAWQVLRVYHLAWGGVLLLCMYLCLHLINSTFEVAHYAAVISVCTGLVLSCSVEFLLYRPLIRRRASGGMMLVASLGCLLVVQSAVSISFGTSLLTTRVTAPGDLPAAALELSIIVAGLVAIPATRLPVFRLQQAVGDDLDLARSLGIRAFRTRMVGIAISGALVGLLAFLIVQSVGVQPSYGLRYVLWASIAVLMGGARHYAGWVVGGLVLASAQIIAIWWFSAAWADLVAFSLVVIALLFRARGLLTAANRAEASY